MRVGLEYNNIISRFLTPHTDTPKGTLSLTGIVINLTFYIDHKKSLFFFNDCSRILKSKIEVTKAMFKRDQFQTDPNGSGPRIRLSFGVPGTSSGAVETSGEAVRPLAFAAPPLVRATPKESWFSLGDTPVFRLLFTLPRCSLRRADLFYPRYI